MRSCLGLRGCLYGNVMEPCICLYMCVCVCVCAIHIRSITDGYILLEYESRLGLPHGTFLNVIKYSGQDGTWAKLERGEISWNEFCQAFSEECANEVCIASFSISYKNVIVIQCSYCLASHIIFITISNMFSYIS